MKNLILFGLLLSAGISMYLFYDAVTTDDNDYNPTSEQVEAILSALMTVLSISIIGLLTRNFKILLKK